METTDNTTPATEEKHNADWYAKSAYECFIKNADPDTSDANPVAAIQRIFDQRASEDLKAQVKTEGKTAEGAYQFLWAVARLCKQTDGGCHISPETGYAIAMHYFQDVPASVLDEFEPALKAAKRKREAEKRAAEIKAAAEKAKLAAKDNAKKDANKKTKAKSNAENAPTTPQDAPSTPTTNEQPASKEAPSKHAKPTPPPSAQLSLFDSLFA